MKEILRMTARELIEKFLAREISVKEVVELVFERIEEVEPKVHSFITLVKDYALERAQVIDEKIRRGEKVGRLCGVPISIKDNICVEGVRTTCASRMLMNFIAIYDATVVRRIKEEDGVIIGKTNMDEYAMGSSTETSYFGPTFNPWDLSRVPGGSSGGSAASVATSEAFLSLGSDTGGSIRCPASFCSVVGLKPTYGRVSRYGLISYANSLEQIGPITKDVYDCALLLSVIAGYDANDSTSVNIPEVDYTAFLKLPISRLKLGIPKEFFAEGVDERVAKVVWRGIEKLEELGVECEEISLSSLEYALPSYYLIAMSEASSNLARYDGVRYGYQVPKERINWEESFCESRGIGFGAEVKRRIILGTYALSAGYYDQYYLKAQKVRTLIRKEFKNVFKKYDALIGPTMPILPFKIGEKIGDPLSLYMCDINTVPANLYGGPAISVPCGFVEGLPVGMQIMGDLFDEGKILQIAYAFEQSTHLTPSIPPI